MSLVASDPAHSTDAALQRATPALAGRIPSLDGLRGISILLVLLGHWALSDHAPRWLTPFGHFGNIGVRFFFIISGLLITTLLLKERGRTGSISIRQFYLRRVFRIFPAAYFLILVIAIFAAWGRIALRPGEVLYASIFLMNYHDFRALYLGQLWSLAVEEQFYLFWPALLLLAGLRRSIRFAWVLVLTVPLLRAFMWYGLHASDTAMTKHFESVADALMLGCLLAVYFNTLGNWAWYRRLQAFPVVFLGGAFGLVLAGNALFLVTPGGFYVWGQSLANVGTALVVDWAIRNPDVTAGRLLNARPLVLLGVLSYSLYLWQNPFLLGSANSVWTSYPYNLGFAFAAALASYFLIEKPFLQLKERFSQQSLKAQKGAVRV